MKIIIAFLVLILSILPMVFAQTDAERFESLFRDAHQSFSAGRFDETIEIYQQIIPKLTDNFLKTTSLVMVSSCYLEKGISQYNLNKDDSDYKKAIEYAEKALEVNPTYWPALANIGAVYMNMDNLNKADHYFTEAEKYISQGDPGYQQLAMQHAMVIAKLKLIENQKGK